MKGDLAKKRQAAKEKEMQAAKDKGVEAPADVTTPADEAKKREIWDLAASAVSQYMAAVAFVVAWSDDAELNVYDVRAPVPTRGPTIPLPVPLMTAQSP